MEEHRSILKRFVHRFPTIGIILAVLLFAGGMTAGAGALDNYVVDGDCGAAHPVPAKDLPPGLCDGFSTASTTSLWLRGIVSIPLLIVGFRMMILSYEYDQAKLFAAAASEAGQAQEHTTRPQNS